MLLDKEHLTEEAIALMAEDLRCARTRLGITSARAAKLARMSLSRYRQLESGRLRRSRQNAAAMYSAAERLGLETVRVCHVDLVDQYLQAEVVRDKSPTIFFDNLDSSLAELKEQGHFVSPRLVLDFVNREGSVSILDSRKPIDKMMVELWVTAIYTLSLNRDSEYYVSVPRDDPPDTEVLVVNSRTGAFSMERVEITQYGSHSPDLSDVLAKKLTKRYQDGTVLLVLVEEEQHLPISDLYDFIRKNNPHRQRIFFVGGAAQPGKFKVIPWDKVIVPGHSEEAWMEISVGTRNRDKERCKYDGVVFKPPFWNRLRRVYPTFVKSVSLRR